MHPELKIGKTYTVIQPEDVMMRRNYAVAPGGKEILCRTTEVFLLQSMMEKKKVTITSRESEIRYRVKEMGYIWTPEMFKETYQHYLHKDDEINNFEELML